MNKANTQKTIEDALFMYKETVSPSKDSLINILNQIPEKETVSVPVFRRVTRSPYIWIAFANLAVVCSLVIVLYPKQGVIVTPNLDNPFSQIDAQVEQFETTIDQEDAAIVAKDYTL